MEFKKPDYPKMLMAYIKGKPKDILEEECQVNTKEEADTWIAAQTKLNRYVKERSFTKNERRQLPWPERWLVAIPRWAFLAGGFVLGWVIGKFV